MFYPSARYCIKHKTTSILIFFTFISIFQRLTAQESEFRKIMEDPLSRYFMRGFASFYQCMQHSDSLSPLFISLSLSLSLSRYVMLYQKTRFFVSKFPARPWFYYPFYQHFENWGSANYPNKSICKTHYSNW